MLSTPPILIKQICYAIGTNKPIFENFSLSFNLAKTGLVGKNGIGKSTLLKLIMQEIQPDSGSIETNGSIAYCPQELHITSELTVSDLLGVTQKLEALTRILNGCVNEIDFVTLSDDWSIRENIQKQLATFGLAYIELTRSIHSLSGGEKTRLMLAKVFLSQPDFIIFDEPTNNLDLTSRQALYTAIEQWGKGILVVSHDRSLLNLMNQIVELTSLEVNFYGGNYDHYLEQKAFVLASNEQQLLDAKKRAVQTKSSIQASYEKREQKQSRGRNLFLTGKIDRITANSKKGRSEKTQCKNARLGESMQANAEEQLERAKSKIEVNYEIDVSLPKTKVANGKILVSMEAVTFTHSEACTPIINQFTLKIAGPERIALLGPNGSGKTTLVKLIRNELTPSQGSIYIGTDYVSYLDQNVATLDYEASILDNFIRINPTIHEKDARHSLAHFLFRNVSALKIVKNLSGGEKLRALLACVLMSENPPHLLILDEPTNHLDFDSIISIESALKQYQGALIIISHDQKFLENIGVQRTITAPFSN